MRWLIVPDDVIDDKLKENREKVRQKVQKETFVVYLNGNPFNVRQWQKVLEFSVNFEKKNVIRSSPSFTEWKDSICDEL